MICLKLRHPAVNLFVDYPFSGHFTWHAMVTQAEHRVIRVAG